MSKPTKTISDLRTEAFALVMRCADIHGQIITPEQAYGAADKIVDALRFLYPPSPLPHPAVS